MFIPQCMSIHDCTYFLFFLHFWSSNGISSSYYILVFLLYETLGGQECHYQQKPQPMPFVCCGPMTKTLYVKRSFDQCQTKYNTDFYIGRIGCFNVLTFIFCAGVRALFLLSLFKINTIYNTFDNF